MTIVQTFKLIKEIFRTSNNPITILLYRAGILKNISINTKNYGNFEISSEWNNTFIFNLIYSYLVNVPKDISPSKEDINIFKKFIEDVLSKEDIVTVDSLKFLNNNTICTVSERLTDKYNVTLNVKDKIVLDLGANICDTALFYAKDGAKKVYSYEASPSVYEVALKNLELNPKYKDIIEIYNLTISDKEILKIPIENDVFSAITSEFNDSTNKEIVEVNTITINEIVDEIEGNVDVLKLDIEGSVIKK
ncbi:MAG: FkbM family methyltransferase [Methanosphaera stadtmanae]|jgi:FkbM family methyltransferase|nr:FkbM family methyltransferase [Methanosphaera stadtmanae]